MSDENTCGCGRSPTGKCVGWHSLTEDQYAEKKAQWEAKQAAKKKTNKPNKKLSLIRN